MKKAIILLGLASLVVAAFLVCWAGSAVSYPRYEAAVSCSSCHSGFIGGPGSSLHDLHTSMWTSSSCLNCHVSTGDNPALNSSGNDANHGCDGCHMGPGLRAHLKNAGVAADANGKTCASCHTSDPTPPTEPTLPPYYSKTNLKLKKPCVADKAQGGEDYNLDGLGLDNDGNLLYEADDTACKLVPAHVGTWGSVKSTYR